MLKRQYISGATIILAAAVLGSLAIAGPAYATTRGCGLNNTVVGIHSSSSATTSETNNGCGQVAVQSGYRPIQNGSIYYLNWKWGTLIVQQGAVSGYTTIQGKHTVKDPGVWPGFPFYS